MCGGGGDTVVVSGWGIDGINELCADGAGDAGDRAGGL